MDKDKISRKALLEELSVLKSAQEQSGGVIHTERAIGLELAIYTVKSQKAVEPKRGRWVDVAVLIAAVLFPRIPDTTILTKAMLCSAPTAVLI